MANQKERYCNGCNRIYGWDDWQEDTCPFCDTPLSDSVAGNSSGEGQPLLDDRLSQNIPWPPGERETEVYRASGYIEAQMIKALLEGAGIPVLLHSGLGLGFAVGDLGQVPVLVPKSQVALAEDILEDKVSS